MCGPRFVKEFVVVFGSLWRLDEFMHRAVGATGQLCGGGSHVVILLHVTQPEHPFQVFVKHAHAFAVGLDCIACASESNKHRITVYKEPAKNYGPMSTLHAFEVCYHGCWRVWRTRACHQTPFLEGSLKPCGLITELIIQFCFRAMWF